MPFTPMELLAAWPVGCAATFVVGRVADYDFDACMIAALFWPIAVLAAGVLALCAAIALVVAAPFAALDSAVERLIRWLR